MIANLLTDAMIKPYQGQVFDDPKEYGLDYENVKFDTSDGVKLSGWLIKGAKDKVIIQSHFGIQCSRSGYTLEGKGMVKGYHKDVHFLRQAKYLNDSGYSVLMYDFRAHGNSGLGTIPWVTWGLEERKDIIAAVKFISNHKEYENAKIGLFSICMGQAASTNAFGDEDGLREYKNLKAMVSVQPLDYQTFIQAGALPKLFIKSVNKKIKNRTGIDYSTNTFMHNVKTINIPTLVIQNKNDGYLDEKFVNTYYNDLKVEKKMLWIEIPKLKNANFNRMAAYDWIGTNPKPILGWFDKYMK